VIDYFLKTKPPADEKITLEILDAHGKVLRTLANHKKEKFEQPPNGRIASRLRTCCRMPLE